MYVFYGHDSRVFSLCFSYTCLHYSRMQTVSCNIHVDFRLILLYLLGTCILVFNCLWNSERVFSCCLGHLKQGCNYSIKSLCSKFRIRLLRMSKTDPTMKTEPSVGMVLVVSKLKDSMGWLSSEI